MNADPSGLGRSAGGLRGASVTRAAGSTVASTAGSGLTGWAGRARGGTGGAIGAPRRRAVRGRGFGDPDHDRAVTGRVAATRRA